jgi:hypothetical protein
MVARGADVMAAADGIGEAAPAFVDAESAGVAQPARDSPRVSTAAARVRGVVRRVMRSPS